MGRSAYQPAAPNGGGKYGQPGAPGGKNGQAQQPYAQPTTAAQSQLGGADIGGYGAGTPPAYGGGGKNWQPARPAANVGPGMQVATGQAPDPGYQSWLASRPPGTPIASNDYPMWQQSQQQSQQPQTSYQPRTLALPPQGGPSQPDMARQTLLRMYGSAQAAGLPADGATVGGSFGQPTPPPMPTQPQALAMGLARNQPNMRIPEQPVPGQQQGMSQAGTPKGFMPDGTPIPPRPQVFSPARPEELAAVQAWNQQYGRYA